MAGDLGLGRSATAAAPASTGPTPGNDCQAMLAAVDELTASFDELIATLASDVEPPHHTLPFLA